MYINNAAQLWQFDVDDTLIMWDKSAYPDLKTITVSTAKGDAVVHVNQKNVNLLIKLAKLGWYIRAHSGSGQPWALAVVQALGIERYVDEVAPKPRGETDDQPAGEGLAYKAYREPTKT